MLVPGHKPLWNPPPNWAFLQAGCWGLWVTNTQATTAGNMLVDISGNNRHAYEASNSGTPTPAVKEYGWCTFHDDLSTYNHGWETPSGVWPSGSYNYVLQLVFAKYDTTYQSAATDDPGMIGMYSDLDESSFRVNNQTDLRNRQIVGGTEYDNTLVNGMNDGNWEVYGALYDGTGLTCCTGSGQQSSPTSATGVATWYGADFPTWRIAGRTDVASAGWPGWFSWGGLWLDVKYTAPQVLALCVALKADPYAFMRGTRVLSRGPRYRHVLPGRRS